MINLDEVTELQDSSVFRLVRMPSAPAEMELDNFIFGTGIQMNLDQTVISRTGYTFLDVLSDVGGLSSIVISALSIIIAVFNHNHFDTFLVTQLFKPAEPRADGKGSSSNAMSEAERFSTSEISGVKEFFLDSCPSALFRCCKRNRKQTIIMKARSLYQQETDIVRLIRSVRYLNEAVSQLVPSETSQRIKQKTELIAVDGEQESDSTTGGTAE